MDAVVARVLDDALANTECEVEPAMRGIALLEVLDDAERMQVVVEPAAVTALRRTRTHSPSAAPVKIWRTTAPTSPAVSVGM